MPVITGFQQNELKFVNQNSTLYDLVNATFFIDKPENNYPLTIEGGPSFTEIRGGTFLGRLDPLANRAKTEDALYTNWNSASLFAKDTSFHIHGCRFVADPSKPPHSGQWDAIRMGGSIGGSLIERIYSEYSRDDCIELDPMSNSGTVRIRDCFFNEQCTGVSCTGTHNNVTLEMDNVLIHFSALFSDREPYPADRTHGPPWKVDATGGGSPFWKIGSDPSRQFGVVMAFDTSDMTYNSRSAAAYRNMKADYAAVDKSWILHLDHADPGFPTPPPGFNVLEGAAARAKWNEIRAAYAGEETAQALVENVMKIDPNTGLISVDTTKGPWPAQDVRVTATNTKGSDTNTFSVANT